MNSKSKTTNSKRRAVIVDGLRTPFCKAFGELTKLDSIALGVHAARAVLARTQIDPALVDEVVWGGVILPGTAPNLGREIALDLGLFPTVSGVTLTRACASGLSAITHAAAAIERGDYDTALVGGSDSTSNAEVKLPQSLIHTIAPIAFGKGTTKDVLALGRHLLAFQEVLPRMPKIAERSTGKLMGEAAEDMATRNEISREAQDEFAARSHHRAAAAIAAGLIPHEVAPITTPEGQLIAADPMVRANTSVDKLAKLGAAFAKGGTLTAGNSTALTDGAACLLLMEEQRARELGLRPLAAVEDWSYVGVDPADQLLAGPAFAIPKLLDSAGLSLADIGRVDLHEAFAGQVLSVLKMLASDSFAKHRLGRDHAVGTVRDDRLNVLGGSLAFGHPFGATGVRMATSMAFELQRSGEETALLGICAAGGLGAAALLRRVS